MKTRYLLLVFMLLCSACGSKKQQAPKDFIEINMVPLIEGEAEKMPLQEWAENVCFIPLETDENGKMRDINEIFQKDDKLLVRYNVDQLSVFDKDGKYLYDIGAKGTDLSEFVTIWHVNLHNDLIYVQESPNRFKVYDWKGTFIKKLVLPDKVWGVITVPGKEEMLAYVSNINGEEPVRFYLMRGEEVLDTVPNPFIYPLGKGASETFILDDFQLSQGALTAFIEVNSDTVYRVTDNWETRPYMVLNMGKYLYSRKERYSLTFSEKIDEGFKKSKYPLKVLGEMADKVYIYRDYERSTHTTIFDDEHIFCYDKQTKEVNKYFLTYPENDLGILEGAAFVPRAIFDDKYLVDWEKTERGESMVLIVVEPKIK